ncbi:amino acid ABC transporter permease [Fodinisporobacter ferrooxydans]|uniref:Amino acid ABC transporter permease n=1 Tax=Fodinisporobacter ferrooxydans TaxID=2901836 RepID=A0ABY4CQ98_9BACL|nr:amino acid ABC transporter permease [Alicyclobacillaceae bacterium MYW30-H2]
MDQTSWQAIKDYFPMLLQGTGVTLELTFLSVILGTILGLLLGLGRLSSYALVRWPSVIYITFFRGTPLFVQILLVHFAFLPAIFGHGVDPFYSGIVSLTLNSGAYIAEIFRAGIQSIDKGQMEAARSVGMSYTQAMWNVIIPQAFRRMLPPLGNEAIALSKDSSLLAAISGGELAYQAKTMFGATTLTWASFLTAALIYLCITMILAQIVSLLEKKYGTVNTNL